MPTSYCLVTTPRIVSSTGLQIHTEATNCRHFSGVREPAATTSVGT